MPFDITRYRDDLFLGASLEDAAKSAYSHFGYDKEFSSFDDWKKVKGIDDAIKQDNEKRQGGFTNKLRDAVASVAPAGFEDIPTSFVKGATFGYVPAAKTPEDAGMIHKMATGAAHLAGMGVGLLPASGVISKLIPATGILSAGAGAGILGGLYGAIRNPEEGENRVGNVLKDAATFAAFGGGGKILEMGLGKIAPETVGKVLEKVKLNKPLTEEEMKIHKYLGYGESAMLGGASGAIEPAEDWKQRLQNVIMGAGTFAGAHGISSVIHDAINSAKSRGVKPKEEGELTPEQAQELTRQKIGADIASMVHSGIQTGLMDGKEFKPEHAIDLISRGARDGFFDENDINNFAKTYPGFKDVLNQMKETLQMDKLRESTFDAINQVMETGLYKGQQYTDQDVFDLVMQSTQDGILNKNHIDKLRETYPSLSKSLNDVTARILTDQLDSTLRLTSPIDFELIGKPYTPTNESVKPVESVADQKEERRSAGERATFIRNFFELESVKRGIAGQKFDNVELIKEAEKAWEAHNEWIAKQTEDKEIDARAIEESRGEIDAAVQGILEQEGYSAEEIKPALHEFLTEVSKGEVKSDKLGSDEWDKTVSKLEEQKRILEAIKTQPSIDEEAKARAISEQEEVVSELESQLKETKLDITAKVPEPRELSEAAKHELDSSINRIKNNKTNDRCYDSVITKALELKDPNNKVVFLDKVRGFGNEGTSDHAILVDKDGHILDDIWNDILTESDGGTFKYEGKGVFKVSNTVPYGELTKRIEEKPKEEPKPLSRRDLIKQRAEAARKKKNPTPQEYGESIEDATLDWLLAHDEETKKSGKYDALDDAVSLDEYENDPYEDATGRRRELMFMSRKRKDGTIDFTKEKEDKDLKDFQKSFSEDIKQRAAEMAKKARDYKGWKYEIGDRLQSPKSGDVFEVTGRYFNPENKRLGRPEEPMYKMKNLSDGSEGSHYASKSHDYFKQFKGPNKIDNDSRRPIKLNVVDKARLKTLNTGQIEVGRDKFGYTLAINDTKGDTIGLENFDTKQEMYEKLSDYLSDDTLKALDEGLDRYKSAFVRIDGEKGIIAPFEDKSNYKVNFDYKTEEQVITDTRTGKEVFRGKEGYQEAIKKAHEDDRKNFPWPDYSGPKYKRDIISDRQKRDTGFTLDHVKKVFAGQEVIQPGGPNSLIYVKTQGGNYLTVEKVDRITPNLEAFKATYYRDYDPKKDELVGKYEDAEIQIIRKDTGELELRHESVHYMEDIGVLTKSEVNLLQNHIRNLFDEGKFESSIEDAKNHRDQVGGTEDRANFLAKLLTDKEPPKGLLGRIKMKIKEFIDRLYNAFGSRTVEGIARDIESGKIFNRSEDLKNRKPQLYAIQEKIKPFFSKLEEITSKKMGGKMPVDQLRKMLKGNGVTDDEIQNLIGGLTGTVTKQQVIDEIRANTTEFKDHVLGGENSNDMLMRITQLASENDIYTARNPADQSELDRLNERYHNISPEDAMNNVPQFSQYVEPGGTNYHEFFVTAPPTMSQWNAKEDLVSKVKTMEEAWDAYDTLPEWQDGHSQYSDIQNPIVRVRFNDREIDGKRILFLEEMQGPSDSNQKNMPDFLKKRIYDIGVKRMLAYAKEGGYDGIAWTTGKMQADRYDLSKYIDSINWSKHGDVNEDGFYRLIILDKSNKPINSYNLSPEDMIEYIGKDAANKIISSNDNKGELRGLDLEVGGEGLKALYDRVLPNLFKKYGKEGVSDLEFDKPKNKDGVINPEITINIDGTDMDLRYLVDTGGLIGYYQRYGLERTKQVIIQRAEVPHNVNEDAPKELVDKLLSGQFELGIEKDLTEKAKVQYIPITDKTPESYPQYGIQKKLEEKSKTTVKTPKEWADFLSKQYRTTNYIPKSSGVLLSNGKSIDVDVHVAFYMDLINDHHDLVPDWPKPIPDEDGVIDFDDGPSDAQIAKFYKNSGAIRTTVNYDDKILIEFYKGVYPTKEQYKAISQVLRDQGSIEIDLVDENGKIAKISKVSSLGDLRNTLRQSYGSEQYAIRSIIPKVSEKLDRVKSDTKSLLDAYKRPVQVPNTKKAIGKYTGNLQIIDHELSQTAKQINASVPKDRQKAITRYMQAGGDDAKLREWANASSPENKVHYEAALKLTPEEKAIAQEIRKRSDEIGEEAKDAGILANVLENYVRQQWQNDSDAMRSVTAMASSGYFTTHPREAMKRVFESYFAGEQKGYKEVDSSIGFQHVAMERSLRQAIEARKMLRTLMNNTEEDGRPTVAIGGAGSVIPKGQLTGREAYFIKPNIKGKDTGDYRFIDHPALRSWKWISNDNTGSPMFLEGNMWIHPQAYDRINALLGKSMVRNYKIPESVPVIGGMRPGDAALKAGAFIKGTILIGPFHQFHVAEHAVFHKVNPFNLEEINFDKRPLLREGVEHGLMLVSHNALQEFGEGLASGGLFHRMPVIGDYLKQYQEWLFQGYIPKLKATMFEHAVARAEKEYAKDLASGKFTRDQLLDNAAMQANSAFGEMNYKYMGRNPTLQDAFRLIGLAPDFLEARLRFAQQAVSPYGKEQAMALIRGALIMGTLAQVTNMIIGDDKKPHWDKPFSIIVDGKEYSPRSVVADMMHLATDPRGFAYNRLNPLWGKPLIELASGKDSAGRKLDSVDLSKDILKAWLPMPGQSLTNKSSDTFLRSTIDTVLQSVGITNKDFRTNFEKAAQDKFHERIMVNVPKGERDRVKLIKEYGDKIDRLKKSNQPINDVMKDIRADIQKGKLYREDLKALRERMRVTRTEDLLRSLSAEDVMGIIDKATPEEMKGYNRIIRHKLLNLKIGHPERFKKLMEDGDTDKIKSLIR